MTPELSRWNDLLGPFYTGAEVVDPERRTLLTVKTSDGVLLYPAFQFDDHNEILAGLPEVLQCFQDSDVDDWTLAGWLVSPSRTLDGLSVVEWLGTGRNLDPVLCLARDAAHRFCR